MVKNAELVKKTFCFRSSYSVIFVAFDKNHEGKIGSKRFISDYLLPHVVHKYGCRVQVCVNNTQYNTDDNDELRWADFYHLVGGGMSVVTRSVMAFIWS